MMGTLTRERLRIPHTSHFHISDIRSLPGEPDDDNVFCFELLLRNNSSLVFQRLHRSPSFFEHARDTPISLPHGSI